MSQSDRTRFREFVAVPASLAMLALFALPAAVSDADQHTVTVEVAFVDRIEVMRKAAPSKGESVVSAQTAQNSPAIDGNAPVARLNVMASPGRPLTAHVRQSKGGDEALPDGLICSFGNRRDVPCGAGGITVTSAAETEFRLDRSPGGSAATDAGSSPATVLEVTIAYQ